jgi:hypothetical protein
MQTDLAQFVFSVCDSDTYAQHWQARSAWGLGGEYTSVGSDILLQQQNGEHRYLEFTGCALTL